MSQIRFEIVSAQVEKFLLLLGIKEKGREKLYPLTYSKLKKKIEKKLKIIVVELNNLTTEAILSFLTEYNIKVERLSIDKNNQNNLAGAVFSVGELGIIFIPQSQQPNERKMFTLAHELGHYFIESFEPSQYLENAQPQLFNRDVVGGVERDNDGNLSDHSYIEFKANQFAAELLMPKKMVERLSKKLRKKKNYIDVLTEIIVKNFGVSDTAARIRIQDLGLD